MNYSKKILFFLCAASYITTLPQIVQITTAQQFENALNSTAPAIIKFYQQGCSPCNAIKPFYVQASMRFPSITFYEMDADIPEVKSRYKALQKELRMYGVPQCLFISNGHYRLAPEGSINNTKEKFLNDLISQIKQQFNITSTQKEKKPKRKKAPTKRRTKKKKKTKQNACSNNSCNA